MPLPFALNPILDHLPVYHPGRPIEEVARELNLDPDSIIKLASNENPLGPSRLALAAMRKALPQLHLYPDGNAFYLKEKLAQKLDLTPANLVLGNGSNEIIELLGHLLLNPEAEVIASQYCFAVYPIVTALFGAKLVTVPTQSFVHDLDATLTSITEKTRLIFVANPNNAPGRRFFERAFRKLKLEFVPTAANFVLLRVGDGQGVFEQMQRAGVIARPMGGYQLPEWIRISIGTSKENHRCLEALKGALG